MKVLIVNAGSSSLKFTLYESEGEAVLASGLVERIGLADGNLTYSTGDHSEQRPVTVAGHHAALKLGFEALTSGRGAVLKDVGEIDAVGHRVVHGGESFARPSLLTERAKQSIRKRFPLAPLHNPPNLAGVEACEQLLPGVPQVGVFDTAFHMSMPQQAFLYALPYELYEKSRIRRYGFHGTSHQYVWQEARAKLGEARTRRVITCHLGNGCSMAAILDGKSVDTSMGLTPLEGLVMGTRTGDIDPGVLFYLMRAEGLSGEEVDRLVNEESGLLGLAGLGTHDMRDILAAAERGEERPRLALAVYTYRIRKYIGAYAAALGGLDAVVFTAGVGENSGLIRQMVCEGLGFLGLELDPEANERNDTVITTPDSPVAVLVIPTDEEVMILRDTLAELQEAKLDRRSNPENKLGEPS